MNCLSPSKYTGLNRLLEIRSNHYLSSDGKRDYSQEETDRAIAKRFDKLMDVDFVEVDRVISTPKVIVMPPYPKPRSLWDSFCTGFVGLRDA